MRIERFWDAIFFATLSEELSAQVTFAIHYLPLPERHSSKSVAITREAAAHRSQIEVSCERKFETHAKWGESHESRAPFFHQFAEEIGLEQSEHDVTVADLATAERVQSDLDAGQAFDGNATSVFFLNERIVPHPQVEPIRALVLAHDLQVILIQ